MVKLIEYADLIAPSSLTNKVLTPNYIPIHPSVYDADFPYTPEFIEAVKKGIPDSMRKDLAVIELLLGRRIPLFIGETEAMHISGHLNFREITHAVDSNRKSLGISLSDSNIDIDRVNVPTVLEIVVERAREDHPMPIEKLKEYAFEKGELVYKGEERLRCHSWHRHNLFDHGLPLLCYFRNFAILFNNMALERLGIVER